MIGFIVCKAGASGSVGEARNVRNGLRSVQQFIVVITFIPRGEVRPNTIRKDGLEIMENRFGGKHSFPGTTEGTRRNNETIDMV